ARRAVRSAGGVARPAGGAGGHGSRLRRDAHPALRDWGRATRPRRRVVARRPAAPQRDVDRARGGARTGGPGRGMAVSRRGAGLVLLLAGVLLTVVWRIAPAASPPIY